MKLPKIFKRTESGKIQEWEIEVDGNKYRTISGLSDGKKTVTQWTICYPKNLGRANATTAEQQAMIEAQAKRRLKLEAEYTEDASLVDKISDDIKAVMLAHKLDDKTRKYVEFPAYMQPKFDGMRCRAVKRGLFSRNGKQILAAKHISSALEKIFEKYPDIQIDGELYSSEMNKGLERAKMIIGDVHSSENPFATVEEQMTFEKVMSLAKKLKPTPEDDAESAKFLEYHVYDIIGDGKFSERYAKLIEIVAEIDKHSPGNKIVLAHTVMVRSFDEVDHHYEHFLSKGFEGAMLRLDSAYETKRTRALLKIKPDEDSEYVIIAIEEGEGNRTGMAGRVKLALPNGGHFYSNIIGNHDYCKKLLRDASTLSGAIATIRYQNLTADGIPRFPYMKTIRDYE